MSVWEYLFNFCTRRRRRVQRRLVAVQAISLLESRILPAAFLVDSLADVSDGDFSSGDLTLREAIERSNALAGADTISFEPSLFASPQTLTMSLGQFEITDSVTISGPGMDVLTIDANRQSRVMEIDDGDDDFEIEVAISGLSLTRGFATDGNDSQVTPDDSGGAIRLTENLLLSSIELADNEANAVGGAIISFQSSGLELRQSRVLENSARSLDSNFGGAIANAGGLRISGSQFVDNYSGDFGGAVYGYRSSVTAIVNTTFSGNRGSTIRNRGIATLENSSVLHSVTAGIVNDGTMIISNSTISGHLSHGIRNDETGDLAVINSTVTANISRLAGAGIENTGVLHLANSIVADNYLRNGTPSDLANDGRFSEPILTGTHNIIGDPNSSGGLAHGINGNIVGQPDVSGGRELLDIESLLEPLADNGGPTLTHRLIPGSVAVDAGDPNFDPNAFDPPVLYDQRGELFDRVIDGDANGSAIIDIGAFEAPRTGNLVVSETDGDTEVFETGQSDTVSVRLERQPNSSVVVNVASADSGLVTASATTLIFTVDNWDQPQTVTLLGVEDAIRTSHSRTNITFTTDAAQSDDDFDNAAETVDVQFLDTEASITVDSIIDESDGDFGSGDLSLREALEIANADTDVDVIVFSPVVFDSPQTILLSEGELLISNTVRVIGPGRERLTIDANEQSRVLLVDDGDENVESVVKVKQLKIARGRADDGDDDEYTLDDIGGGIFNREALELVDAEVNDSYARHPDFGGGIHNEGSLTFVESLAANNGPSAVYNSTESTLVAKDVHILNTSRRGLVNAGVAELTGVAITGSGTSGLFNSGLGLHLTNSTISGNNFGGIVYDVYLGGGTLDILSSTITNNIASDSDYGGLTILRGFSDGVTGNISNSIVAGNQSDTGEPRDFSPRAAMSGSYNLIGAPNQAEHLTHGENGNIVGQDDGQGGREALDVSTILRSLADNGGLTSTHAIVPGSLAVDAGDPFYDQRFNVPTDQRGTGFDRIENGDAVGSARIDIGAFELPREGTLVVESPDDHNEVFETGEPITFVVSLNRLPTEPVVVTAASGTSMTTVSPAKLTFTPGNWNQPQTITVQAVADGIKTGHLQVPINLAVAGAESDDDFDDATSVISFRFVDAEGSIIVDSIGDESDGDFSTGQLTFREAIELANSDSGIDLIEFDETLFETPQTITLTGGQFRVTDELLIIGPGRDLLTIDADKQSRIFRVDDNDDEIMTHIQASGFTLINGKVVERDPRLSLEAGGAILNRESLTVTDITIRSSEAVSGGGIYSDGGLTVTNAFFQSNIGLRGGAITNRSGKLEITEGNFSENVAHQYGGGIYNTGDAIVQQATFEKGVASYGGGILNRGRLDVREFTASGNEGSNGGGGIYHAPRENVSPPDSLSVRRATFVNNRSLPGDSAAEDPGAGITIAGARTDGAIEISNTLFAGNFVQQELEIRRSDLESDQPIAGGFNLISDPRRAGGFVHGISGNIIGQDDGNGGRAPIDVDELVEALADNGGVLLTHALVPNSIAIDAGDPSFDGTDGSSIVNFDQRGEPFARTFDGNGDGTTRLDIGAFELAAFTLVVVQSDGSTVVDEGSTDSVAVSLSRAPVEPVVIHVSVASEDRLSSDTTSLIFTSANWSQPQTITLTGIEDDAETGDLLTSLNLAVNNETSDDAFDGRVATIVVDVRDNDDPAASGDIDGDADFDANDSFLIQLVQLSASDAQIDISKGSSPLSATQIRAAIAGMQSFSDVDGDNDFDANDAFLIHLVKLSGTNANIDSSKGSSSLTAVEIRERIDSLNGNEGSTSAVPSPTHTTRSRLESAKSSSTFETPSSSPRIQYRDWIDAARL